MDAPLLTDVVFTDIYALYQHIRHIDHREEGKQYLCKFEKQLYASHHPDPTLPLDILDQQLQKHQECVAIRKKEDNEAFQYAEEIGLIYGSADVGYVDEIGLIYGSAGKSKILLANWQKLEHLEKITMLSDITGQHHTWVGESGHADHENHTTPNVLIRARRKWTLNNHPDKTQCPDEKKVREEKMKQMDLREITFKNWLVGESQQRWKKLEGIWKIKGDNARKAVIDSLRLYESEKTDQHLQDVKCRAREAFAQYSSLSFFYWDVVQQAAAHKTVQKNLESLFDLMCKSFPNGPPEAVLESSVVDCVLNLEEHLLGVLLV